MPQICRGVACLLVVALHGGLLTANRYGVKPLLGITDIGFSGVHMFFVISGLIIYHAHHRELGDARGVPRYLLKRLVRIYPFYWIVFFILGGRRVLIQRMEIGDFLTNALFFTSTKSLVIGVSWTLAYEMIFYGIFVAFLVKRNLGVAALALWFGMIALNQRHPFSPWIGLDSINALFMMGLFASTLLIALRGRLSQRGRDRVGAISALAGSLVFAGTAWYYLVRVDRSFYVWHNLPLIAGFGTGSALLLFASVSARVEGFLKQRRLLLLIGDASYSVYLVHIYFQKRAASVMGSLDWVTSAEKTHTTAFLLFAVYVVVPVGAGILIHKVVEKPVLTWFRRVLKVRGSARVTA